MSVELDLSRKPAVAAATLNLAGQNLAGLGREGLRLAMIAAGVEEKKARMRATQLWRWIYHYGVTDFAKMTDVAKELRALLVMRYELVARLAANERVGATAMRDILLSANDRLLAKGFDPQDPGMNLQPLFDSVEMHK